MNFYYFDEDGKIINDIAAEGMIGILRGIGALTLWKQKQKLNPWLRVSQESGFWSTGTVIVSRGYEQKDWFVLNTENQYNRLFCNSRLTFAAVDFSTAVLIKTTING